jgi:hypothetical protein
MNNESVVSLPSELWGGKSQMYLELGEGDGKVFVWTKEQEGVEAHVTLLGVFLCGPEPQFVPTFIKSQPNAPGPWLEGPSSRYTPPKSPE